jgi:hypothetical protein
MDGRGRWLDNVFVEWLWRSLKYEEVHLKAYANGLETRIGIGQWFRFYNDSRPPSFGLRDPAGVVGDRSEPCGFAAALGRRRRVAHNSTAPATAERGLNLTRKRAAFTAVGARMRMRAKVHFDRPEVGVTAPRSLPTRPRSDCLSSPSVCVHTLKSSAGPNLPRLS